MNFELRTCYDSRKSFYGKATVNEQDGLKTLTSYQTEVAIISDDKAYVRGMYSNTTLRHIKEFLLQNGFQADSWKQISKDYSEPIETKEAKQDSFSTLRIACAVGSVLCKDKKEQNAWDKRMLSTQHGISFPADWDSLSEEDKTKRLSKCKEQLA